MMFFFLCSHDVVFFISTPIHCIPEGVSRVVAHRKDLATSGGGRVQSAVVLKGSAKLTSNPVKRSLGSEVQVVQKPKVMVGKNDLRSKLTSKR